MMFGTRLSKSGRLVAREIPLLRRGRAPRWCSSCGRWHTPRQRCGFAVVNDGSPARYQVARCVRRHRAVQEKGPRKVAVLAPALESA